MNEASGQSGRPKLDFEQAPFLVLWELTRACALACRHCRAEAQCYRSPAELSTQEAVRLLDDLSGFERQPLLVLTGGDPTERSDLFEIISEAKRRGFSVAITPSATDRTSDQTVRRLKEAGIARLAISLDAADAATHDAFRQVVGSFDRTIRIINWAREENLPIQINTTVCRQNIFQFARIADLVEELGATLWSVFFLVPTGRATADMQITALEAELVLKRMAFLATHARHDIKSTACPQFRRVLLTTNKVRSIDSLADEMRLGQLRSYQAVNDGKGIMFISHTGEVYPSGFLPISAGNVRGENVCNIYSQSKIFQELRDPVLLRGKCGGCRYSSVCGGSRARAFAASGDYRGEDPLCIYREPHPYMSMKAKI